jgi:cytochrome c553
MVKSLLTVVPFLLTFVALFTMLEMLGRTEKRWNVEKLKKIHRINGYVFTIFFLVLSYICLDYMWRTGVELNARTALHSVFALAVLSLLFLKMILLRSYRGWYAKVPALGLAIVILFFQVVGTSAAYYFVVTHFGQGRTEAAGPVRQEALKITFKDDKGTIDKGKQLFEGKCGDCHETTHGKAGFSPGLKGILKNPVLPSSGRPATPEAIVDQMKRPFGTMPSFAGKLSDEEMAAIASYLNTL